MSGFPITQMAPPQTRTVSLRNVTPSIPENPIHFEELKQDSRLGEDEVRRAAGAPMGTEEGAAGPGDGATGAA